MWNSLDPGWWLSQNPDILYVNSGGGLGRSTDGGKSWKDINHGLPQSDFGLSVQSLAIDPAMQYRLCGYRRFVGQGYGCTNPLTVVTPGPIKPRHAGLRDLALAIDPTDPQIIYAGGEFGECLKALMAGRLYNLTETFGPAEYAGVR